jgi:hypothetical protein
VVRRHRRAADEPARPGARSRSGVADPGCGGGRLREGRRLQERRSRLLHLTCRPDEGWRATCDSPHESRRSLRSSKGRSARSREVGSPVPRAGSGSRAGLRGHADGGRLRRRARRALRLDQPSAACRRAGRVRRCRRSSDRRVPGRRTRRAEGRVNAVTLAPIEDFRRDSDLFGESVDSPETEDRLREATRRGLQTREWELDLGARLGDL